VREEECRSSGLVSNIFDCIEILSQEQEIHYIFSCGTLHLQENKIRGAQSRRGQGRGDEGEKDEVPRQQIQRQCLEDHQLELFFVLQYQHQ
jgi:hypothetical protein